MRIDWIDETNSTMEPATQWLRNGGVTPYWIAARRQTAGRGQHGRRWWSGDGALFATAAIRFADYGISPTPEIVGRIPLLVGVIALEVVQPWLPGTVVDTDVENTPHLRGGPPYRLGLKWPNDLCYRGRKLAGILIESPKPGELVIGIGINVNNSVRLAPPEIQERIAAICDFSDIVVPLESLLDLLAHNMDTAMHRFAADPGSVIRRARPHCLLTGQQVRIGRPTAAENSLTEIADVDLLCAGICHGMDDDGRLIVESTDGATHQFSSATVRILAEA